MREYDDSDNDSDSDDSRKRARQRTNGQNETTGVEDERDGSARGIGVASNTHHDQRTLGTLRSAPATLTRTETLAYTGMDTARGADQTLSQVPMVSTYQSGLHCFTNFGARVTSRHC